MLLVKSEPMELRGLVNKTSASGKTYYIINSESEDGTPYALYCPNANAFPQGLKKGDKIVITFEVTYFKNQERLVVTGIQKVLVEKDR